MKKIFSVIAGLFILLMLPMASFGASPGPYVSANLGMSFLMDADFSEPGTNGTLSYDPGFASTIAAGYNFGMFRAEGEIGYQTNSGDKEYTYRSNSSGDMTALSFMVNGYFDLVNSTPFTPFITAGIGIADLDADDMGSNDTVFAYQFGAGIGYAIVENFNIDLTYRYFATEDPEFGNGTAEFASNNVYLGLRYNF
jgi:opacity protein-like surface antigen